MIDDQELEEALDRIAGPVNRTGVWAAIEARAGVEPWAIGDVGGRGAEDRAPARARKLNLRFALYASVAVAIVAVIAVGSLEAVEHLGRDQSILVITDDTTGVAPGSTAETGQTTATGLPSGYWQRLPLTTEGGPTGLLIMDPSNPAVLYVSTPKGLFKSTDAAETWNRLPAVPGSVFVLAIDPTSPSTIYAAYWGEGPGEIDAKPPTHLLRSDNGGMAWTDLNDAGAPRISPTSNRGVWFDSLTSPSTIYMYNDDGYVCRSADRGVTWTRLSTHEGQRAVEWTDSLPSSVRPASQQALDAYRDSLLESNLGFVYLTDADSGAVVVPNDSSWGYFPDLGMMMADPQDPSILYAATGDGVYKSADAGGTWHRACRGLVNDRVDSVLVDPDTPSTLYATTSAGVFRSINGGTDWSLILAGRGSIVLSPSAPSRLYAWTTAGLFRSDDHGSDWTRLDLVGHFDPSYRVARMDPTPLLGRVLLVGTDQPDTVFVYSPDTCVYRSTDAGGWWQESGVGPANGGSAPFMVVDPGDPSTIYAVRFAVFGVEEEDGAHVLKSVDAGATWTELAPGKWGDLPVTSLAVDPYDSNNVWTVQGGTGDGEQSVIRRSTDGGATWQRVEFEGLGERTLWLLFDPHAANTFYACEGGRGFSGGTLFRSLDGGATWHDIGNNVSFSAAAPLVPDPTLGGALYAATEEGLFKRVPDDQ